MARLQHPAAGTIVTVEGDLEERYRAAGWADPDERTDEEREADEQAAREAEAEKKAAAKIAADKKAAADRAAADKAAAASK
jgi:colicin import membrane protein